MQLKTMSPREQEQVLVAICAATALGNCASASSKVEASVMLIASGLIRSQYPTEANRLAKAGNDYLNDQRLDSISAIDALKQGVILGLPRFKDMLSRQIQQEIKNGEPEILPDDSFGQRSHVPPGRI